MREQVVKGYPLSCNATLNLHHSKSDNLVASKPAGILITGQSECNLQEAKREREREREGEKKVSFPRKDLVLHVTGNPFDVADLCWT